jgi:hypothetical protein
MGKGKMGRHHRILTFITLHTIFPNALLLAIKFHLQQWLQILLSPAGLNDARANPQLLKQAEQNELTNMPCRSFPSTQMPPRNSKEIPIRTPSVIL